MRQTRLTINFTCYVLMTVGKAFQNSPGHVQVICKLTAPYSRVTPSHILLQVPGSPAACPNTNQFYYIKLWAVYVSKGDINAQLFQISNNNTQNAWRRKSMKTSKFFVIKRHLKYLASKPVIKEMRFCRSHSF